MAQIRRIRSLQGAGILADMAANDAGPVFLKNNLVYGFNGSGKSTLSRLLACLHSGVVGDLVPAGCAFEFEMADGRTYHSPDNLKGLEQTVCVFNADFIERNLSWANGTAKAILYIGEGQKEDYAELKAADAALQPKRDATHAAARAHEDKKEALAVFKRTLARSVSARLHQGTRRYEADRLQADYDELPYDQISRLAEDRLRDLEDIARRSSAVPDIAPITNQAQDVVKIATSARESASATVGQTMVRELEANPQMVPWAKTGLDYHVTKQLADCLFCGESLTAERKAKLAAAFDDALSSFLRRVEEGKLKTAEFRRHFEASLDMLSRAEFAPELKPDAATALNLLRALDKRVGEFVAEALRVYDSRQASPTVAIEAQGLAPQQAEALSEELRKALMTMNDVIRRHNEAVADFAKLQSSARENIRKHYLAEGHDEYTAATAAVTAAKNGLDVINGELTALERRIQVLQQRVRQHGPAASEINKLVRAYLGHGELTIHPADSGYELHRHGKRVEGLPSEGEKTAIAICYFLSTLRSDDRKLRDLIVVVDDPVSSLDTRAMNYACSLLKSSLRDAAQVFVLTHNQLCMNEFKKEWKKAARERKKDGDPEPTATLSFLDVTMSAPDAARTSNIVKMHKLLREHDSEYHFLCHKVLAFERKGPDYFEQAFLMPNVMRKVLEIFLAFRVPGSHETKAKIASLCKGNEPLSARMAALERLAQIESHTDLDDLIAHSAMTIEESRDANAALLFLMETVDKTHTDGIRELCKA